jgi:hypothetical protein
MRRRRADDVDGKAETSSEASIYSPAMRWVADVISFVVVLLLVASVSAPTFATRYYDPSARPSNRMSRIFDVVFQSTGSLLAMIPWFLRSVAYESLTDALQSLQAIWHPMPELFLQLLIQSLRFVVFAFHVSGQHFHCWFFVNGACTHKRHLLADHVFLGVAVQACLAVEIAASAQTLHRLLVQHKFKGTVPKVSFVLYGAALITASALLALTTGEAIDTARFFHPPREIVAAVAVGAPLFFMPAIAYLYSWSELVVRDP